MSTSHEKKTRFLAIAAVFALYTVASSLDYQYQCETDTECEQAYPMEGYDEVVIETYGDWADVGCTEESRLTDEEFDRVCLAFERAHPEADFTHN